MFIFLRVTSWSAVRSHLKMYTAKFHDSSKFMAKQKPGLILGVYESTDEQPLGKFTPAAEKVNGDLNNKLRDTLTTVVPKKLKVGKSRLLHGIHDSYATVAVVCIGPEDSGFNRQEERNDAQENTRISVASCVRQMRDNGQTSVLVDPMHSSQAAAEGATLSLFSFDKLKQATNRQPSVDTQCFTDHLVDKQAVNRDWTRGVVFAEGQNLARHLMESPANLMTPQNFYDEVKEYIGDLPVSVTKHDRSWIESEKMASFLSVANGSDVPPLFVEIEYKGAGDAAPIALVGKGITFDSGGISLKPSLDMDIMRGDMGGASCVAASIYTAARLKLPINLRGFVALTENMPSGKATKPGDVFTARNGKTIQVSNTDAEGRLVLADALNYAETCHPSMIMSMATLTGAIGVALGSALSGTYSTCNKLWETMQQAGTQTGDRMWRMPLLDHYSKQMTDCLLADVDNLGSANRMGGSCTAAAFLKEFVTHEKWMHLDIAGVMYNKAATAYLSRGMTGRPTRTVVEFLSKLSHK